MRLSRGRACHTRGYRCHSSRKGEEGETSRSPFVALPMDEAPARYASAMRYLALASLALCLLSSACGRAGGGSGTVTPSTGAPGSTGAARGTPVAHSPEAQAAIDAALRDATTRLGGVAASVERAEQREWGDSSLGCPQPGSFYAQVITPGYLIVVAGGAKRLEYHTDTRGRAVMCREL